MLGIKQAAKQKRKPSTLKLALALSAPALRTEVKDKTKKTTNLPKFLRLQCGQPGEQEKMSQNRGYLSSWNFKVGIITEFTIIYQQF